MKTIKTMLLILFIITLITCDSMDSLIGVNGDFLSEEEEEEEESSGGSGAFSPTSISSLALWLDASDTSTITTTGTDVDQWNDKSGNGNHFIQGTPGFRPDVTGTGLNNKNTIRFTQPGTNNKMLLSTGSINCLVSTIFIVYEPNGDTAYYFLGNNTALAGYYRISASAISTFNFTYNLTNGIDSITTLTNFSDNNPHILMVKFRGTNNKLKVSKDGDVEINSAQDLLKTIEYPFSVLGADTNASTTAGNIFNGDIAEVIIYTTVLSDANKQKIEGYLAHKWGLTGNLPADHPYKTSAP